MDPKPANATLSRLRTHAARAFAALLVLLAARLVWVGWTQGALSAPIAMALTLCALSFYLFRLSPQAMKLTAALSLLAAIFLPLGIFNPFAAIDYMDAGAELPSVPGTLVWLAPLEVFLLAAAYLLDLPPAAR